MELVDVDAGSMTEMIPFEPGSHFLNGRGYIQSDYTPGYEAADEKLYIVHGGDPQLYVYLLDGTTAQLDTMIQLDIPGFRIPEGKDRKEFQEGHVEIQAGSASVRNIHIVGDLLLLNYYSGTDPKKAEEVRALRQEGKDDEAVALSNKSREETPNGTLVYSLSELSYLGHASPPVQKTSSTYASGGGFAWFQKTPDPEVEEDFLRIYKMKLVAK